MLPGSIMFDDLSRYSDYHEKTFSHWFAMIFDLAPIPLGKRIMRLLSRRVFDEAGTTLMIASS